MFGRLFEMIQPVVKNILILNLLFFLATYVFEMQGINLRAELALYYFDSPNFRPYQIATHFFMHGNFTHLLFNMLGLLFFGNMLERVWGAKKFALFYFITAVGAAVLHQLVLAWEIYNAIGTVAPFFNDMFELKGAGIYYMKTLGSDVGVALSSVQVRVVGASGAIFGVLTGAAMLFPNRTIYVYAVLPVKIKWLALFALVTELMRQIENAPDDNIAHFAHLGGMLFGFIMIKIWQRNRNEFY